MRMLKRLGTIGDDPAISTPDNPGTTLEDQTIDVVARKVTPLPWWLIVLGGAGAAYWYYHKRHKA